MKQLNLGLDQTTSNSPFPPQLFCDNVSHYQWCVISLLKVPSYQVTVSDKCDHLQVCLSRKDCPKEQRRTKTVQAMELLP